MKLQTLLTAAAIAMTAGFTSACSSNEDVAENAPSQQQQAATGDEYITLNVNMPTRSGDGMRTMSGDFNLDDGTADEYAVSSVAVYFQANNSWSESSTVSILSTAKGDDDNVTEKVTVKAVVPDEAVSGGKILVVCNGTVDSGDKYNQAQSYSVAQITTDQKTKAKSFIMTNSTYNGTSGVADLVQYGATNVYKSTSTAQPVPVDVYVERLAAKVTLTAKDKDLTSGDKFTMVKWGLNVINKTEYPVKQIANFNTWLTGDGNGWGVTNWNVPDDHRSHWAVDPNYSTFYTSETGKNIPTQEASTYTANNPHSDDFTYKDFSDLANASGGSEYCTENTFNNWNQTRDQTTTAVILAKYQPKGFLEDADWYRYAGTNYNAKNLMLVVLYGMNFYNEKGEAVNITEGNVNDYFKLVNGTAIKTSDNTTIGYEGNTTIENLAGKPLYSDSKKSTLSLDAANKKLEKADCYAGGYCYYSVPIKHYADIAGKNGAPYEIGDNTINDNTQLGRYGVVRNHWYDLNVNSVAGVGKPITSKNIPVPEVTDDPKGDNLINVNVKVLSWAKRTQTVDL